jgi:hypothetical protein
MATLWETMVFSLSSKSWKTSGLRTLRTSVGCVSCNLEVHPTRPRKFESVGETYGYCKFSILQA